MLEDRIRALCEANKYNIHTDRHLIGLPRLIGEIDDAKLVEAQFAVYQTDQEGETRLFATGLYRDRIVVEVMSAGRAAPQETDRRQSRLPCATSTSVAGILASLKPVRRIALTISRI